MNFFVALEPQINQSYPTGTKSNKKTHAIADMENVNSFTWVDFFNPKFYPEVRKLRQNQIYNKTAEICI